MPVGTEGPFDAVLQDREINPRIALGLVLRYSEDEDSKGWQENRVPPLPPSRRQGALTWTHKDPLSDLVFAQEDWSEGAFRPYYRDLDRRYAQSDGVDLRFEGVAALGPKLGTPRASVPNAGKIRSNFLLANGDFEEGLTSGWTAGTGTTHTVETTASLVKLGTYAAKLVVAQSTAAGDMISQTLANPTTYQSREIRVIAYVQRTVGSDSGILVRIADNVGSTDSSIVTASGYAAVSVTRTIDAAATSVTISVRHSATTTNAAHTFYVDEIHVVPTGGVEVAGTATRNSTDPDELYMAIGRCITIWNETNFRWDMQHINVDTATTDIAEFNDVIYVGYGDGITGSAYVFGNLSLGFIVATQGSVSTDPDRFATFFVKARNGVEWALWKGGLSLLGGASTNDIQWSIDPTNSGSWEPALPFVVGSSTRAITGLHTFGLGGFVVTKVDGVWRWNKDINDFENITQEWEEATSAENGKRGQFWQGALYLTSVRQGFHIFTGTTIIDISDILLAPRLADFGGKVFAMAGSPRELWLALDTPTADATVGKTTRLCTYSVVDGKQRLHTLHNIELAIVDHMAFHRDTRLHVLGQSYNSDAAIFYFSAVICFQPDKSAAPFRDTTPASGATPNVHNTGFLETSIWHGGAPETPKGYIAVTIWSEDLDLEHTITVSFGRDGRATNDRQVGIFDTSEPIQTLFFKDIDDPQANAQGRFLQVRFTFDSDDSTSPKMYAFAIHTQLAPPPVRLWTLNAVVGNKTFLRTNVFSDITKAEALALFQQLEAQVFPLTFIEDLDQAHDGKGTDGARLHQVRLVDFGKSPLDAGEFGEEVWRVVLQEVPVDG